MWLRCESIQSLLESQTLMAGCHHFSGTFFHWSGYLILSGKYDNAFLRSCFIPHTGFHVRCCPETPPFSVAQSGDDTAPAYERLLPGRGWFRVKLESPTSGWVVSLRSALVKGDHFRSKTSGRFVVVLAWGPRRGCCNRNEGPCLIW